MDLAITRIALENTPAYLEGFWQPESGGPCLIICPGGAFLTLSENEGMPVAKFFADAGFSAFVLHYSVGPGARADKLLCELALAVKGLRTEATAHGNAAVPVNICGFSAGGYLCALLATKYEWAAQHLCCTPESVRPDRAVLCYARTTMELPMPVAQPQLVYDETGHVPECFASALRTETDGRHVLDFEASMREILLQEKTDHPLSARDWSPLALASLNCPPCFLWTTRTDTLIPCTQSTLLAAQLSSLGVEAEYHLYDTGEHGLGLAQGTPCAEWARLAVNWLHKPYPAPGSSAIAENTNNL